MKKVKVKVVATKDQLKEHQIYLNNLVSDEVFIMCGDIYGLREFFTNFPSETSNKKLLCKYIDVVESMFLKQGFEFDHLIKYFM